MGGSNPDLAVLLSIKKQTESSYVLTYCVLFPLVGGHRGEERILGTWEVSTIGVHDVKLSTQ